MSFAGIKRVMQSCLSLLWLQLAAYFITRVMHIDKIDGKSHKMELKSSRNNRIKPKSCH